jgi:hypothetical protein
MAVTSDVEHRRRPLRTALGALLVKDERGEFPERAPFMRGRTTGAAWEGARSG